MKSTKKSKEKKRPRFKPVHTTLSLASDRIVQEFDAAAKDWGWTNDQGTTKQVNESGPKYDAALKALVKRIQSLETQRAKFFKAAAQSKDLVYTEAQMQDALSHMQHYNGRSIDECIDFALNGPPTEQRD